MLIFSHDGSLIPTLNETSEPFLAICQNANDCKELVEKSGWQTDFSANDYSAGIFYFDDTIGVISKFNANLSTLFIELRELMEV